MVGQESEFATGAGPASAEQGQEAGSVFLRWLLFYVVCLAAIVGLMWAAPAVPLPSWISKGAAPVLGWFLIPLASFMVPAFLIRRVPHRQRKLAWQIFLPLVLGAALGFTAQGAGEDAALKDRGRWVEAKVVAVENANSNKTRQCTLRTQDGQAIKPDLEETHGCEEGVDRGETLRVLYDPEEVVAAEDESWKAGSSVGVLAVLAVLFVGFGTWGCVRMSRQGRE